jgi:hypothetical protein
VKVGHKIDKERTKEERESCSRLREGEKRMENWSTGALDAKVALFD